MFAFQALIFQIAFVSLYYQLLAVIANAGEISKYCVL